MYVRVCVRVFDVKHARTGDRRCDVIDAVAPRLVLALFARYILVVAAVVASVVDNDLVVPLLFCCCCCCRCRRSCCFYFC